MYKKVLLAYDGSIEGRRALREGAKLAQMCRAEVFLLAVVEVSSIMTPEAGLTIPIELQTEDYKAILNEGSDRLKALGFSPTARLEVGDAGQKIAEVAEEIGAHLVVVGHRPQGPLAGPPGAVGGHVERGPDQVDQFAQAAPGPLAGDQLERQRQPVDARRYLDQHRGDLRTPVERNGPIGESLRQQLHRGRLPRIGIRRRDVQRLHRPDQFAGNAQRTPG